MKKLIIAGAFIAIIAGTNSASAATTGGTLTVTGTIESSISLTVESAGGTTSGTGTAAATSDLGSIAKYGMVAPTGFTLTRGAKDTNWTLSSAIGVEVVKANSTSADYLLTAELLTAPDAGVTWKLNGNDVVSGSALTIESNGAYSSTLSYDWDIVIADSAAAAAIDNTINFTATSN